VLFVGGLTTIGETHEISTAAMNLPIGYRFATISAG
jgi:hypothetical protein